MISSTYKVRFTPLLLLLMIGVSAHAQPDRLWQEKHYSIQDTAHQNSLWGSIGFNLQSNTISNALFNQSIFDGTVNPETSAALRTLPSDSRTLINAGFSGDLWYKHKTKKGFSWLLGFSADERALGNLPSGLVQLYFEGNAPFEGERVPLGPGKVHYWSYQGLGLGIEFDRGGWRSGATVNVLKLGRYQSIETGSDSYLFTENYGQFIEASVDLDWRTTSTAQNKVSAWYGTGFQTDLYLSYAPADAASSLSLQLIDVGMMHFSGLQRNTVQYDTLYQGIAVNDVLNAQANLGQEVGLDSLEALIGLNRSNAGGVFFLPGRLQIDYTHDFSSSVSIAFQLQQFLMSSPPRFRSGLAWRALPWLALEPYFRVGGFSRFDYGLTGVLNAKNRLQCIVRYGLVERQIAPENTSGQGVSVSAALHF
jgi:hypothetical protein